MNKLSESLTGETGTSYGHLRLSPILISSPVEEPNQQILEEISKAARSSTQRYLMFTYGKPYHDGQSVFWKTNPDYALKKTQEEILSHQDMLMIPQNIDVLITRFKEPFNESLTKVLEQGTREIRPSYATSLEIGTLRQDGFFVPYKGFNIPSAWFSP